MKAENSEIRYNPAAVEDKWYSYWLKQGCFHSEPDDRVPYTVVIPPPNVTGILHMGHVLNNTLNDVLVRKARMDGKNACWVPGTDHASIATEAKVVERLKAKGISKEDLSREEFLKYAWEWKEEHGGIILQQLRKLGASCDWERTRFTMEPELSQAVISTFCYFYRKGLVYRGVRMVNWDPVARTAISDDEVIHKETQSKLYYLKYHICDASGKATEDFVTIATTRPETIMADAAVCVNPEDERYHHLKGKQVLIPLINRAIPMIEDSYVEKDFGSGCLKITPAHDAHDYEIGLRHKLPVMEILDDSGYLNENAQLLVGEERFEARKKIVNMLQEAGLLLKEEVYTSPVAYSERSNAVIEPKLSTQWFLKMEKLAAEALESVESGKVKFIPDKYRNTYRHWMENVRDWCISRQLWWGQRIPAYYLPDGSIVVEESPELALQKAREKDPSLSMEDLKQDEDVLDTWFSSWLWPISVFDPKRPGHPEHKPNKDLSYYYPTNDLVTGPDIIFFWVARMIMAGNEFMEEIPFHNVYFTGIVRDKLGRKMSKTLGNSPDPLELIAKYGADAVRLGMLLCSSAGNDILYDEAQVEQGRNFCTKIWNSWRLVSSWRVDSEESQSELCKVAVKWFDSRLSQAIEMIEEHYSKFRISDALMSVYKLFWDDYCSWYLELIKPAYGKAIDRSTWESTLEFFEKLLKLIHPVMPFISEELWQTMSERTEGETIMLERTPSAGVYDNNILISFDLVRQAVMSIRGIRSQKNIPEKQGLSLHIEGALDKDLLGVIGKFANVTEFLSAAPEGASSLSFIVGTLKFRLSLEGLVDLEEESSKLQAELERQKGFLTAVRKKLSNDKFVSCAPEAVVAMERKKEADSLERIKALEEALEALK